LWRGSRDYKKARIGAIIAIIGIVLVYSTYPLNCPLNIAIIMILLGLVIVSIGLGIMYYYGTTHTIKESRKSEEKVDEFLRQWERRRKP